MGTNSKTVSIFLILPLLLLFAKSSFSDQSPSPPPVYDILAKYGLPSGLLPDSVESYTLSDDGSFTVELNNPCYIQFDYLVYYEEKISGKLKYGSITDLKGIQVKRFFFWFDVDEIRVDLPPSDSIYFTVGVINKKLDIDQFQTVRSCRDGKTVECGRPWMEIFKAAKTRVTLAKSDELLVWSYFQKLPPPIDDEIRMLVTE